jgi:solute carrier family 29 (equilibrative nucleoside transporter), member 1/2/3
MLVRTVFIADRMPGPVKTLFSAEIVLLAVMLGHAVLTRMPEFHGVEFFKLTIASIVVVAMASTLMQDGLLRLVSTFPPKYTQAVVSGQAMAGVVVALSNVVILAADGADDPSSWRPLFFLHALHANADLSAFVYFVFVFLVVLLSTVAFLALTRMPLFRHYHHHSSSTKKDKPYLKQNGDPEAREKLLDDVLDSDDDDDEDLYLVELLYKVRHHGAAVFLVFCISVAVFPGVTSLLHSNTPEKGRFFRDLFVPVGFVIFNTCDLLGRWTAASVPILGARRLLAAAVARVVFCPLFMFCNLQNQRHETISLVVFKSDFFSTLFLIACGYTNGLVSTQALMQYPRVLTSSKEKELGGTLMFFLLSLGLCAGALLSFVLIAMLKP